MHNLWEIKNNCTFGTCNIEMHDQQLLDSAEFAFTREGQRCEEQDGEFEHQSQFSGSGVQRLGQVLVEPHPQTRVEFAKLIGIQAETLDHEALANILGDTLYRS